MLRELYFTVIYAITEWLTGLTNGQLKLWDIDTWARGERFARCFVNVSIILLTVCAIWIAVDIVRYIIDRKKNNIVSEEQAQ